jgi:hypothetical protein
LPGCASLAEFYDRERSGTGPAGTVVAYSTDTFHRGTVAAGRSLRDGL